MMVRTKRGLGGLGLAYYEMPDAATQALLAERGISIEIVPDTRQADAEAREGWLPTPPPPVEPVLSPAGPLDTATIEANINARNVFAEQQALYLAALNGNYNRAAYDSYMNMVRAGVIPTTPAQATVVPPPSGQVSTNPIHPADSADWLARAQAAGAAYAAAHPPSTPAPAAGGSGSYATTVVLVNNNGTSTRFSVGDTFKITVTGAPNSPVKFVGGVGGNVVSSVIGTTNAAGQWVTTGTMTSAEVGEWVEEWYVGGTLAGKLTFTVSAGGSAVRNGLIDFTGGIEAALPPWMSEQKILGIPAWMILAGVAGYFIVKENK